MLCSRYGAEAKISMGSGSRLECGGLGLRLLKGFEEIVSEGAGHSLLP